MASDLSRTLSATGGLLLLAFVALVLCDFKSTFSRSRSLDQLTVVADGVLARRGDGDGNGPTPTAPRGAVSTRNAPSSGDVLLSNQRTRPRAKYANREPQLTLRTMLVFAVTDVPPLDRVRGGTRYGFYLHAFKPAAAVTWQVRKLKEYFPGSPVYIMSDGGDRFDSLCAVEGCKFKLCPPANDRWHPWPFLRRFYEAAVALDVDYIIMLEPDNTIHRAIKHPPTHDAGGMYDENPHFGNRVTDHAEAIARKSNPKFKWEFKGSGLAGGAYFRREAVLKAFSDEAVAAIDWDYYCKADSKRVFSSDFAMPIALSEKGFSYAPWSELRQVEPSEDRMLHQPKDAAFQHYGRGVKGGKPTYNLRIENWTEDALHASELPIHKHYNMRCQRCWNLTAYVELWGSTDCANPIPYTYSSTGGCDFIPPPPVKRHQFYPIND